MHRFGDAGPVDPCRDIDALSPNFWGAGATGSGEFPGEKLYRWLCAVGCKFQGLSVKAPFCSAASSFQSVLGLGLKREECSKFKGTGHGYLGQFFFLGGETARNGVFVVVSLEFHQTKSTLNKKKTHPFGIESLDFDLLKQV